jgi:hypothetical protein
MTDALAWIIAGMVTGAVVCLAVAMAIWSHNQQRRDRRENAERRR